MTEPEQTHDNQPLDELGTPEVEQPEELIESRSTPTDPDITLVVPADRMSVLLSYPRRPAKMEAFLEALWATLEKLRIPETLLNEELASRVSEAWQHEEQLVEYEIMHGVPPTPPVDGKIVWSGPFFVPGFMEDERTGAVDYRKPLAKTNVDSGDQLCVIEPPVAGVDGRDVFGQRIPTRKPSWPQIRTGPNVQTDERHLTYFAMAKGRIRWAGGILSVDEEFVVKGNVGLRTGDIHHNGALIVEGDIESGSEVEAIGQIEVRGMIEGANVKAGGDLTIHGGIAGKEKNKIVAGGRIHARFILDADVEAEKDIVVEREILQSNVKTRGAVALKNGRLVGGETTALTGVLTAKTGSEALVRTVIYAGKDFRLQAKIDRLQDNIDELGKRRELINHTLGPVLQRHAKLTGEAEQAVAKLQSELNEIDKRIGQLGIVIERLRMQSKEMARPRIEVSQQVFPESIFCISNDQLRVREEVAGPVHLLLLNGEVKMRRGPANWGNTRLGESEADEPSPPAAH